MLPRLFNKGIFITTIFLINFSNVYASIDENVLENFTVKEEYDFTVTGYYTPLENQSSYINGSYEAEVKMNGEGVHMASGKKVFMGAIAAPKNFPFGTKIYLEGYGVGVVEDRGGSIKNSKSPRIDLWTGTGDEGLLEAKKLGFRHIKGYIINDDADISINFGNNAINTNKETKKLDYDKLYITPESNSTEIKKLEILLANLGIYNGEIDGIYKSVAKTIINFQLDNGIIENKDDENAGYFGPKTIKKIKEVFPNLDKEEYLNENEIIFLRNKVKNMQNKFLDKYSEKAMIIKELIRKVKKNPKLNEKTKIKLDYLENII